MIDHSVVGDIVRELYELRNKGNNSPNYLMKSPAMAGEQVKAKDMLRYYGSFRNDLIVKQEHLPADPNIRAIISKPWGVLVETSRVDFDMLEKSLREENSPVVIRGVSAYIQAEKIIKSRTQNVTPGRSDSRTLLTLLPKYGTEELNRAIEVIDILDQRTCFNPSYVPSGYVSGFREKGMRLELNLELLQELKQMQTPALANHLQMNAMLYQRMDMLRMNNQELGKEIRKQVEGNPILEAGE